MIVNIEDTLFLIYFKLIQYLTLTISARVALAAAFLVHHGSFTALRTQVTDAHLLRHHFLFDGVAAMSVVTVAVRFLFHDRQRTGFLAQIHIQYLTDAIR